MRVGSGLDGLVQDLHYGLRALLRAPGFGAVVILTIGLGVGAVTAVYTVVDPLLLRPVPFRDPDSLYTLWNASPRGATSTMTPQLLMAWRTRTEIFDSVEGYVPQSWAYRPPNPDVVEGALVTPDLFRSLGIGPRLGRGFGPEDGSATVAIISDRVWRTRFGGADDVLGQRLFLQHGTFTIVGVWGADFRFPTPDTDVWLPADVERTDLGRLIRPIARTRGGLTFDVASDLVAAASPTIETREEWAYVLQSLHWAGPGYLASRSWVTRPRTALFLILGAVGLVLVTTCANVATLMASRTILRRGELTVRAALGAGRLRLARQLLTESLLWAVCGGLVGVVAAYWVTDLIARFLPASLDGQTFRVINPDWRMLVLALGAASTSGLAAGVLPALYGTHGSQLTLRSRGPGHRDRGLRRARSVLLVAQVVLATVLTVAAGLVITSYLRLTTLPLGLDPDGLVAMEPVVREGRYANSDAKRALLDDWAAATRSDSRIEDVAVTTMLPLRMHMLRFYPLLAEDRDRPVGGTEVNQTWVSPEYFGVIEASFLQGQPFTDEPQSAVISQGLARRLWGDQWAVGRRFRFETSGSLGDWMTVAGVIGDVREVGYDAQVFDPVDLYLPLSNAETLEFAYLLARGADHGTMVEALREQLRGIAPEVPVRVHNVRDLIRDSAAEPRFQMLLLLAFAALALVLAAGGIYGVVSRVVSDRTHEIGVRMALGARPGQILGLVLRRELWLTLGGVLVGLGVAAGASRLMSSMLFEVEPTDLGIYLTVTFVFLGAAAVASWTPARRATRVDPATALRDE